MAHIELNNDLPGILSLFSYRPTSAVPMYQLAEVLLRGDSPLTSVERELIAAHVSKANSCEFCFGSHNAAALALLANADASAPIEMQAKKLMQTPKMDALLSLAESVCGGGKCVTQELINSAKTAGASEVEIHDTILIAAAFCMFNRYVDGLATTSANDNSYAEIGTRIAEKGYSYESRFDR